MKRLQLLDANDFVLEPLDVSANQDDVTTQIFEEPLPFWRDLEPPKPVQRSINDGSDIPLSRGESIISSIISTFLEEDAPPPGSSPRIRQLTLGVMGAVEHQDEGEEERWHSGDESVSSAYGAGKDVDSQQPPRYALDDVAVESSERMPINKYMRIVQQPPREVRTRKKKEKRSFAVKIRFCRPLPTGAVVTCKLVFADDFSVIPEEEECSQQMCVTHDQEEVLFQDLGVTSPCLKWKDREFCLELALYNGDQLLDQVWTRRIYAYSNIGVLQRRREVEVVALSARHGSAEGGMRMHLVGRPFFKSDRLKVVFRMFVGQRWLSFDCEGLEFYSESVLFFTMPRISLDAAIAKRMRVARTFVQVTNDGVNFSNGLEFIVRFPCSSLRLPSARQSSSSAFAISSAMDLQHVQLHGDGAEELHQSRL